MDDFDEAARTAIADYIADKYGVPAEEVTVTFDTDAKTVTIVVATDDGSGSKIQHKVSD